MRTAIFIDENLLALTHRKQRLTPVVKAFAAIKRKLVQLAKGGGQYIIISHAAIIAAAPPLGQFCLRSPR